MPHVGFGALDWFGLVLLGLVVGWIMGWVELGGESVRLDFELWDDGQVE